MGSQERKNREQQIRRQQILDAAGKIFAARGFKGATMRSIAEEAEYSQAAIYLYFKNKDELYASVLLEVLDILVEKIEDVSNEVNVGPAEKVNALAKALNLIYESDPVSVSNGLQFQFNENFNTLSPELASKIKDGSKKFRRAMAGVFEDGMRKGIFFDCHPVALVDIVWSLFSGLVLWDSAKKGIDPGEKDFLMPTFELAIEIIGQGIKKN